MRNDLLAGLQISDCCSKSASALAFFEVQIGLVIRMLGPLRAIKESLDRKQLQARIFFPVWVS